MKCSRICSGVILCLICMLFSTLSGCQFFKKEKTDNQDSIMLESDMIAEQMSEQREQAVSL